MSSKPHIFPFSIAYADTDAGGIVYHARYIEMAERARMLWLNNKVPTNGDVGFVIRELHMKYKKPLKLADEFVIESILTDVGNASLKVEQKFIKDGEVHAIMTGSAAYIGADLKPKKISDEMLDALEWTK